MCCFPLQIQFFTKTFTCFFSISQIFGKVNSSVCLSVCLSCFFRHKISHFFLFVYFSLALLSFFSRRFRIAGRHVFKNETGTFLAVLEIGMRRMTRRTTWTRTRLLISSYLIALDEKPHSFQKTTTLMYLCYLRTHATAICV